MNSIPRAVRACLLAAALVPATTFATENGLGTYPIGVNTVLNGVLPPPGGTQFYNYSLFYVANRFAGPDGNAAVPGFRSAVFVDAPRVVHTWGTMLGPFAISSGIVVPVARVNVDAAGSSGTRTGLGDIILQPFMIGYTNPDKTFFTFLSPDVSLRTGSYSSTRLANIGTNYYAFQPNLNATWFPSPKWELSATAQLEVHSPNHATQYHSGTIGSIDWLVGYAIGKKLQVGVQGYYLKQVSDDKQNGQRVGPDGFRGQAAAIGPQLRYDFGPAAAVVLKYQHEFAVRNRSKGERIWIEFAFPI